jgi:hypothetical protein
MIRYVAPADDLDGMVGFFEQIPPGLSEKVELIDYSTFLNRDAHEPGIVILGNYELISKEKREEIDYVCDVLARSSGNIRIFNFPGKAMGRYALLKMARELGINEFSAYRPDEIDGQTLRYPVFIRDEYMHTGSISDLIDTPKELEAALQKYHDHTVGRRRSDLLIVEFCDVKESDGIYRKFCAFRFGDSILAKRANFSHQWMVKFDNEGFLDPSDGSIVQARLDEDLSFSVDNPHKDWLMNVFKKANIEYGRIDYGVYKGKLQVWEINTYPEMGRRPMKKRTQEQLNLREKLRALCPGRREAFRNDLFAAMSAELEKIEPGSTPVSVDVPRELRRARLKSERSGEAVDRFLNGLRPTITSIGSFLPSEGQLGGVRNRIREAVYQILEPRTHRTKGN